MKSAFIKRLYLLIDLLLKLAVEPRLRAFLLRISGAKVGTNVRIYTIRIINPINGFKNLKIANNVHIGTDCLFDLSGVIEIGEGSTLAPRVVIMTHSDAGDHHNNPLCQIFPSKIGDVKIGAHNWIGTGTTILASSSTGEKCVIGAMSLVNRELAGNAVYVGIPARKLRPL